MISLRPATGADSELVYAIKKAAFRQYVEKQYGRWDEAEQWDYHVTRFAAQDFKVIEVGEEPVGFIAVVQNPDCIKVNQLMLRPEQQGKGIGEHCLGLVKEQALTLGLPIRLQVMKVNPRALRFYRRVGFVVVGETDTHHQMQSTP